MDSDSKDVVEVTLKNKKYYFGGIIGTYIKFCGSGLMYGSVVGAMIGGSIGVSICLASPIILGLVLKDSISNIKFRYK